MDIARYRSRRFHSKEFSNRVVEKPIIHQAGQNYPPGLPPTHR